MTKNQMIALVKQETDNWLFNPINETEIEWILNIVEKNGMLPPTQACTLVPDKLRGGHKHSEAKRQWDIE